MKIDFLKIGAENNYYEVKDINVSLNQITLSSNLTEDKIAGTLIKLRIAFLKNYYIFNGIEINIGGDIAGGMGLPKGYSLHIHYNHVSPPISSYNVIFSLAYKY